MSDRMRLIAMSLVFATLAAPGCGGGGSTSEAATPRDEKSFGATGGQHALGSNPDAELARMKKVAAQAGAGASAPGRLPGR